MKGIRRLSFLFFWLGLVWLLFGCRAAPATETLPVATVTRRPTATQTQTQLPPSETPVEPAYPQPATATADPNPVVTLTPIGDAYPAESPTSVIEQAPPATETPSVTPVPSETPLPVEISTATPTSLPAETATPAPYPGYPTLEPTYDPYPANPTPQPTYDPYPGQQPTATPLPTAEISPTPTSTIPWPTETPTLGPSPTPTIVFPTRMVPTVVAAPDITATLLISMPMGITPFQEVQALPDGRIYDLAFSPNGLQIGAATSAGVQLYSAARLEEQGVINSGVPTTQIAYLPGSQSLVSGGLTGRIEWWLAPDWDYQGSFGRHQMGITGLVFNSLGNLMVSGGDDNRVRVWDTSMVQTVSISAGRLSQYLSGFNSRITALAISPNGQLLAVGAADQLQIWSPVTGGLLVNLPGISGWVTEVVFSPDGSLMATADANWRLQIWQVSDWSRKVILVMEGIGSIQSLAFRPDAGLLACGHADGKITLWDPVNGQYLGHYQAHTKKVTALAFNDSGGLLASASYDGWLKIWQPGMILP